MAGMEDAIPYAVLVFNCFFFKVMRVACAKLPLRGAEPFVSEFIATLELCTGCGELGTIYEAHGVFAMAVALLFLCLWWCVSFEDAAACNVQLVEDLLLEGGTVDKKDFLQRHAGMMLGAIATQWYIMTVWSFHMTEEHRAFHQTMECEAGLRVTPLEGFLVECLLSFLCRLVALESTNWTAVTSSLVNSLACVVLVVAGLEYTGGFFNPILAFAFNFNCKGNTFLEHVIVYWAGAIVGGVLARVIHRSVTSSFRAGRAQIKLE